MSLPLGFAAPTGTIGLDTLNDAARLFFIAEITAQLNGMTFDSVIKVICGSFGLEYSVENGVYILKEKTKK